MKRYSQTDQNSAGLINNDATSSYKGQLKLTGDLGGTADNPATPTAVHVTGNETIAGIKTFSSAPIVPTNSFSESAVTNLVSDLGFKATDLLVVHLAGNETITGIKTFTVGTFLDKGNKKFDIQAYGGVPDAKQVLDGVTTSGSPTLTSATANFTLADNGKTVTVVGAGAVAQANTLVTTITYVNPTTVTMGTNAAASLTGACVTYGTDNSAAYAAAISAITAAKAGEIWFGRGGYLLQPEQHISNVNNVGIVGENRDGTVIYMIPVGSFMRLIYLDGSSSGNIIKNPYITNITLSSTSAFGYNFTPQNNYYGIAMNYTNGARVSNVRFQAFHYDVSNNNDTDSQYSYLIDETGSFSGTSWLGSQGGISVHSSVNMMVFGCRLFINDTAIRIPGVRGCKIFDNEFHYSGIEVSNSESAGYAQDVEVWGNSGYNIGEIINIISFADSGTDVLSDEGYNSAVDMINVHDNIIYLVDVQSPTGILAELGGGAVNSVAGSNVHIHHNWIYGPASNRISNGIVSGANGAGALNWHIHDNHTFNMGDEGMSLFNLINSSVYDNQNVNFNRRAGADGTARASAIRIEGSANYPVSNVRVERNMADGKSNTGSNAIYLGDPTYISGLTLRGNTDQNVTNHLSLFSSLPTGTLIAGNPNVAPNGVEATNISGNAATVTTNANLTGDVTSVGNATTIATNTITNAKAAQMAANTIKGNNTSSTANAIDLTTSQVKALLAITESDVTNLVSDLALKAPLASPVFTGDIKDATLNMSLYLGATNTGYAVIERGQTTGGSSTDLYIGEANDTGHLYIRGINGVVISNGPLTLSGQNLITDGTTGTKIGTSASQKLAFYNSTPIVQPSGDVITALQNLGLITSATMSESDVTNLVSDLALKAPLASPTFTGTVTVPTPVNATDAATKGYVDATASGLDVKSSVRALAMSNITLSGTQTIDGVAVIVGDRVLVAGQSTANQNGIYVVASGAWSRSTDANTSAMVTSGMFTFVTEGTVNAGNGFVLTTADPITLGSTGLVFTQFSGAGEITAGSGLSKSGNTISIVTGGVTNAMLAGSIAASKLVGTDIITVGTITTGIWNGTTIAVANGGTGVTTSTGTGNNVLSDSPVLTTQAVLPLLIGSSASGGNLTLESTSHATKGKILFGTSAYDEVNNRLGIGNSSPSLNLVVGSDLGSLTFSGNAISLGNTTGNSMLAFGQDGTHNIQFIWNYNATAGNATATMNTYGYNTNFGVMRVYSNGSNWFTY